VSLFCAQIHRESGPLWWETIGMIVVVVIPISIGSRVASSQCCLVRRDASQSQALMAPAGLGMPSRFENHHRSYGTDYDKDGDHDRE